MVKILDHTGEARFKVEAKNLESIVKDSVKGLLLLYFGKVPKNAKNKKEIEIEVDGVDFEESLVRFLNEIIFMFDAKKSVALKVKDVKIQKTKEGFKIKAKVEFSKLDPKKHIPLIYIKAVTRGGAKLKKTKKGWSISFIVDI